MVHGIAKTGLLVAICATWLGGFCEEKPRATGLLLPPTRQTMRSAVPARAKALLGAAKSSEPIPTSWDSRDNWIGPVKDQGSVSACWAFACYETLETQMRRLGLGDWDFSEKNMVNLNGYTFQEGFLGNAEFAQAYLLRWGGAVAETNDVYIADIDEWQKDSVPRNPPVHVQNVVWIPPRPSFTDNDELKEAIMDYGAVAVPMFFDPSFMNANGAYYYNGSTKINHLVTVIGWDDVYPRSNFRYPRPPGDGAWLVKNSWGEDSGDGGYLHVSYYDTRFHMDSDAYGTVFMPASADEDYTAVYGYDWLGPVWRNTSGNGEPIGAVFRAAWNEELAAVGLYSCVAPLDYKISVYTNVSENANDPTTGGKLAYEQTGCLTNLGYSTIPLACSIPLTPGERYSVVFENTNECERYFYVCAYWEGYSDTFTPVSDATFYKHDNNSWRDSSANKEMLFGNICLKAYTRSTVAAKGGGPGETADGSQMCSFVAETNAEFYAQTAQTFGAFANVVGENSRSLWYSWMAGLDPAEQDDDFTVSLTLTDGVPSLEWSPSDIPNRIYTIYGKRSLADKDWFAIPKSDLHDTQAKFFKVQIQPDTSPTDAASLR